jgi:protein phosphatase
MEIAVGSQPGLWDRTSAQAHVADQLAPGVVLLAVADGFGSVRGMPVAKVALDVVRDALRKRVRRDTRDPRAHLLAAFSNANARVFSQSGSSDDYVAGGASMTATLIVEDRAYLAHVGKSRAYLARDGGISTLTEDDALGGEEWTVARSSVPTEMRTGPLLTRTLGTQATLEASIMHLRLMHADALVLATAGVYQHVGNEEIAYALEAAPSSAEVASRLLELLKFRGAASAGTVIVGRSLTDWGETIVPAPSAVRNAALSLTALVAATLAAVAVLHAVFAP